MPSQSKIILIITDNLPAQINGVVTTYRNITEHAERDGYTVKFIDPSDFYHGSCPGYPDIKIALPWRIGRRIMEARPDHVHIATEGPVGVAARWFLQRRGFRYTTAYHTKFPEALHKITGIPESITWRALRWFHRDSHRVLTTTESMVRTLQDHGFAGTVVPWTRGVDRAVFYTQAHVPSTAPTLVCVSRISREKNLEDFFDLYWPGARKIMVGDGPQLAEYCQRFPHVEFVGAKTKKDLADYYRLADVFVFPSQWETFGIVMIEAMACGTPVAAYPCQGPLDVVDQGLSGCLDRDLAAATAQAMTLDRDTVYRTSLQWDWARAWHIFRDNLPPAGIVAKSGLG
jgi:glycosyltransferase involved in cell wall biosynthesis